MEGFQEKLVISLANTVMFSKLSLYRFASHVLCRHEHKAASDNRQANEYNCVAIKLYFKKQVWQGGLQSANS